MYKVYPNRPIHKHKSIWCRWFLLKGQMTESVIAGVQNPLDLVPDRHSALSSHLLYMNYIVIFYLYVLERSGGHVVAWRKGTVFPPYPSIHNR